MVQGGQADEQLGRRAARQFGRAVLRDHSGDIGATGPSGRRATLERPGRPPLAGSATTDSAR